MSRKVLNDVQDLLEGVVQLQQDALHTQGDKAPNFNLFNILGVEAKEVSTHSAFLAHLLTPGETHAQGDLFLRSFLAKVAGATPTFSGDWVVTRELPFAGGRLDIVLRSVHASTLIAVENKIDTQDSEGQLAAYRKWLDAPLRRNTYKTRLLIYLTPDGTMAKNASGIGYVPVSYLEHIVGWLSDCLGRG